MPSNKSLIVVVISLCVVGTLALVLANRKQHSGPKGKETSLASERQAWALPDPKLPDPIQSDAQRYQDSLAQLEVERVALALRYQQADSATEQLEVIARARTLILKSVYTEVFPSWYGTPWDFNGTTQVPRQGKIACGYFVSTVLRDAGWRVQRARLAQQASENIVLSLTTDHYVKRFRRVAIGDFSTAVKNWGPGVYVVGLDIHTGFIVNTGDEVYFIHSSYLEPYTVVKEKASESKILTVSNYRVLGKVTADDVFIKKWLLGTEIVTRTA